MHASKCVIAVVFTLGFGPARAACTPEQLLAFIDKGISNSTIEQVCGGSGGATGGGFQGNQFQQQAPLQQMPSGQVCITNLGTCSMVIPGFLGQSCSCPSVWGSVVGVIR
jgi:hypothetical protein